MPSATQRPTSVVNEKTGQIEIWTGNKIVHLQPFAEPKLLQQFKGDALERVVKDRSRNALDSAEYQAKWKQVLTDWMEKQPFNRLEKNFVDALDTIKRLASKVNKTEKEENDLSKAYSITNGIESHNLRPSLLKRMHDSGKEGANVKPTAVARLKAEAAEASLYTTINKGLKKLGLDEKFVKGRGYSYLTPGNANLRSSSIYAMDMDMSDLESVVTQIEEFYREVDKDIDLRKAIGMSVKKKTFSPNDLKNICTWVSQQAASALDSNAARKSFSGYNKKTQLDYCLDRAHEKIKARPALILYHRAYQDFFKQEPGYQLSLLLPHYKLQDLT